ncbi:MAG: divergent polysaccharide deacetylase family protein [Dichotomicrobium sp.]
MRALLVTVTAVILAISAGIVVLAISPAPERISDSTTLVIETGSIDTTRSAKSDAAGEADEPSGDAAEASAQTDDKPSLDNVIAARLQETDQPERTGAESSEDQDTASISAGQSATAAAGRDTSDPSASSSSQDESATPGTGNQSSGSVSLTQMLASELDEDEGDSGTAESAEAPAGQTTENESAPGATAPSGAMATSGMATGSPQITTRPDNSETAGITTTTPGANASAGQSSEGPASQSSEDTTIASLDPRVSEDTETGEPARADSPPEGPAEQPDTADQPDPEEETQSEPLAAGEAPALPQKRGRFAVEGRIALIIRGLGVETDLTEQAIGQMPRQAAMAFVPYGDGLQDWTRTARQGRHDVLLQIPLEPEDYPDTDPGPHTLLTSLSIDENLERLDWLLNRFEGVTGVTNYLGGKFASAPGAFAPMLMELKARDLLYVDDSKAANDTTRQLARQVSLAYSVADVVIDRNKSPEAIEKALVELESEAKENGSAIAIGHAHSTTLAALEDWMKSLNGKGLALVPIDELVTSPPSRVSQSTGG